MAAGKRFLAKIDLVALIGQSVPLARSGRIHRGPCPVRETETDTLEVHPSGFFVCHECRREGDAVDWLILSRHLSRSAALRELELLVGR